MKAIPCEVYSRVVGYYRPVHNWNKGKQQEFSERVEFDEQVSLDNPKASAQIMPLIGGGVVSEAEIDAYKIFTFPNCEKCKEVKDFLKDKDVLGEVIDLQSAEGSKLFRNFYSDKKLRESIERDHSGSLKLPIVLFMNQEQVVSAAQSLEQTKSILN
jgi:glutaredoxin